MSIISNSKNFKNFPWETPAYKIKGVFAFAFSLHLRTSLQREEAQNSSYIKGNTNSGARLLIWGPTFAIKLCDAGKLLKLLEFGGEWIHVQLWLGPFTVHMKLSQHCKLAVLQYKIKSF